MKNVTQLLENETRNETIFRHVWQMLTERRMSMGSYAQHVVDAYHAKVAEEARCIDFKMKGDVFQCQKINAQKLSRFMPSRFAHMSADMQDDDRAPVRLPAELEESMVGAMLEPYRTNCTKDLARRYGLMGVVSPSLQSITGVASLAELTREMAEAMVATAPMLERGGMSPAEAGTALSELDDVIASAMALKATIKRDAENKPEAGLALVGNAS